MLRRLLMAIYRGFFWTYERGSWQYDVMVACILIFVLLTPREWFADAPRSSVRSAADVVLVQNDPSEQIYQLRASLIDGQEGRSLAEDAERVLRIYTGKPVRVVRVEPELDSNGQVVSYEVWVRE